MANPFNDPNAWEAPRLRALLQPLFSRAKTVHERLQEITLNWSEPNNASTYTINYYTFFLLNNLEFSVCELERHIVALKHRLQKARVTQKYVNKWRQLLQLLANCEGDVQALQKQIQSNPVSKGLASDVLTPWQREVSAHAEALCEHMAEVDLMIYGTPIREGAAGRRLIESTDPIITEDERFDQLQIAVVDGKNTRFSEPLIVNSGPGSTSEVVTSNDLRNLLNQIKSLQLEVSELKARQPSAPLPQNLDPVLERFLYAQRLASERPTPSMMSDGVSTIVPPPYALSDVGASTVKSGDGEDSSDDLLEFVAAEEALPRDEIVHESLPPRPRPH